MGEDEDEDVDEEEDEEEDDELDSDDENDESEEEKEEFVKPKKKKKAKNTLETDQKEDKKDSITPVGEKTEGEIQTVEKENVTEGNTEEKNIETNDTEKPSEKKPTRREIRLNKLKRKREAKEGNTNTPASSSATAAEDILDDSDEPLLKKAKTMAQSLASETVLSTKDFMKMRKMALKQSLRWQLGKEAGDREGQSSSEEELHGEEDEDANDSDASGTVEDSDDGRGWDLVTGADLEPVKRKKKGKEARMQSILKGREDRPDFKTKRTRERKGGSTNREKNRNKPMLMTLRKQKGKVLQ